MKKIVFMLFMHSLAYSQTNSNEIASESRVFCFTPRSLKVNQVNGMAIGMGIVAIEQSSLQKVNGLDIEINPLSPLLFLFADPTRYSDYPDKPTVIVNGLDISTGRYNGNGNVAINGCNINAFNAGYSTNGVSISGFYNYQTVSNGLTIAGLAIDTNYSRGIAIATFNTVENMSGLQIGAYNVVKVGKGLQIGLLNIADSRKGVQIGLFNKSGNSKGAQIGLWNSNSKRSFPFFNW